MIVRILECLMLKAIYAFSLVILLLPVLTEFTTKGQRSNPFASPSTNSAESSPQYVDSLNMHTFYQPCQHKFQWTKYDPLEQVIGEPSRPILTRNQLRIDAEMCIYALSVSTMEPRNVKEAMTDAGSIEAMQDAVLQLKRLDSYYVFEILKRHGMENCDPIGTPMETKHKLDLDTNGTLMDAMKYQSLWYTKDSGFELTGFLDADHTGCLDTFKSTSEGTQFLAIAISCNPVQHSRTKHIVFRYYHQEARGKGYVDYFFKWVYESAWQYPKTNQLLSLKEYKAVNVRNICSMIQPEPKGSTQTHFIR
nr:hypothetical protein [Tanacetum cinerariifolium]